MEEIEFKCLTKTRNFIDADLNKYSNVDIVVEGSEREMHISTYRTKQYVQNATFTNRYHENGSCVPSRNRYTQSDTDESEWTTIKTKPPANPEA